LATNSGFELVSHDPKENKCYHCHTRKYDRLMAGRNYCVENSNKYMTEESKEEPVE